ncbi:MAG: FAD-binding oxidoreductase, partial [Pseudomonadota bacterium]|nr:FAD-binding oxidoreductase [Pseudomonadota bacterium]
EQAREIDTDLYHGGVVFEEHASIDPAKYHSALLAKVRAAGVTIVPHCRAGAIRRDGDRFTVESEGGTVDAGQVLVATNGYTDAVAPWVRRRVIPIGSYMIATEPLPAAVMDRILPTGRTIGDTRKVVYYYRPSPDRSRVIFGGRVTSNETDPRVSAPLLMRDLVALFPALAGTRISHSWNGFVAYTFDHLPHLGQNDGVYYAAGYCGSGVALATYCGTKVGQKMLGLAEGRTGLDTLINPTRPFYYGRPWFLGATVAYYRWRDRAGL